MAGSSYLLRIVRLLIKSDVILGESLQKALERFKSLERRLDRHAKLRSDYIQFMQDYLDHGHISLVSNCGESQHSEAYFIPHQPIVHPDNLTTKLRVVFDASAKTTLGTLLNDKLMPGPNLQQDLIKIAIRFRTHQFVLTADITMMFRQIVMDLRDCSFQRILWRTNKSKPVQIFQLNTVTKLSKTRLTACGCASATGTGANGDSPQKRTRPFGEISQTPQRKSTGGERWATSGSWSSRQPEMPPPKQRRRYGRMRCRPSPSYRHRKKRHWPSPRRPHRRRRCARVARARRGKASDARAATLNVALCGAIHEEPDSSPSPAEEDRLLELRRASPLFRLPKETSWPILLWMRCHEDHAGGLHPLREVVPAGGPIPQVLETAGP